MTISVGGSYLNSTSWEERMEKVALNKSSEKLLSKKEHAFVCRQKLMLGDNLVISGVSGKARK